MSEMLTHRGLWRIVLALLIAAISIPLPPQLAAAYDDAEQERMHKALMETADKFGWEMEGPERIGGDMYYPCVIDYSTSKYRIIIYAEEESDHEQAAREFRYWRDKFDAAVDFSFHGHQAFFTTEVVCSPNGSDVPSQDFFWLFNDEEWFIRIHSCNFNRSADEIAEELYSNIEEWGVFEEVNLSPFASFEVFPPKPTPKDAVVLASTSADPENDPLTFEWYVDGRYEGDFPSCELGKLKAGKYEITLKVTDSHDNTTEITRVIEVAELAYTFKLVDEQMVLYDFNDSYPIVTFELKGMNWQELGPRIGNVAVTFNLQLIGTNNLGSFRWPADGPASCTIPLQSTVRYLEGGLLSSDDTDMIELTIPLYYILRDAGWLDLGEDPRFYLSHKHLAPDSDDWESAQAKATDIPGQLDLRLVMEPVELFIPSEEIGEPATVIDLSKNPATEASFVLGKKIDLMRDSRLKVGNSPEEPWTAYSDVVVCALKLTPIGMGATIALSIVNGAVHLFKGEVGSALLTWVTAPAHIVVDIVLTVPSAIKVADRYSIPSLVLEKSEQALLKLGYTSLKEIPHVARWPVWVNLDEEKLAFMDPAGILHRVHWPSNLRIPLPYFTMESYIKIEGYPQTALLPPPYRYAQLDAFCQPLEWIEVNTSQNIRVIPYPASFRPVRVVMDNPGEPEVLGAKEGLRIWTDGGGVMLLDWGTVDFGYADRPPSPLGPYAIHPGMENQPREPDLKVYREQYVAVWEGTLKVIDEDREVGIYAGDALEGLICKPAAWCRGRGTEYDIVVTPGEGFRVNVVEGQVDVVNRNMVAVETLNAGSGKEYNFEQFLANEPPIADFAIAPEDPTAEDSVLITSLSTDLDGDPLTYSWYVDGEYYAQASNSDSIVLENLEPGKYDIKLIVEDGWGGQDEYSATVVIGGDGSFNAWTIIWIAVGAILFLLVLKGLRGKR